MRRAADLNWTRPALLASGGSAKLSVADARGVLPAMNSPYASGPGKRALFPIWFDLLNLRGAIVGTSSDHALNVSGQ